MAKRAVKQKNDRIENDADTLDDQVMGFMSSSGEGANGRTLASRERIRLQMEDDIQTFLASGGAIRSIDPNIMADPPRKPTSAYGSRPI